MRGFLWWIDRWRKSTAYVDMTLEEQAAYRNLLDEIALRDGEIPDDERVLARACGDPLKWKRVRATVLRWLRRTEGGWTNDTALEVLAASRRRAEKQRRYRSRRGGGSGGGPGPPGNEPGNARGNGVGNAGGNNPGNADGYKEPEPEPGPEDPSLRSGSPTPAEVRAGGASSATEQTPARSHSPRGKRRPGKGLGPSAAIDYDETDALQIEVAAYCERLAQLDADANGGGPASAREIRQVLQIVSTTPQGQHLSGLKNASRSWLETTLETCRRFEAENYG